MNTLIRIIKNLDDREDEVRETDWHLFTAILCGGDNRVLCTGEVTDLCEYEIKTAKRGGITCKRCLAIIKEMKAIKL